MLMRLVLSKYDIRCTSPTRDFSKKKKKKGQRHDRVRAIQALPMVNSTVREERGKERRRGVLLV